MQDNVQVASLDHAMWFHRPFRADEWLLYDQDSPSANGARGFNRGLIYNLAGELVASTTQEGLVRIHPDKFTTPFSGWMERRVAAKTAVVVVRVQSQIQAIVGSKIAHNVRYAQYPNPLANVAQGIHVRIGDGSSIQINLQSIV